MRILFAKLIISVNYPLICFHSYWSTFDGDYSNVEFLWCAVVTVVLVPVIFIYIPRVKKIETFRPVWFLSLLVVVSLAAAGGAVSSDIDLPNAYRAGGHYMLSFALWTPMIHFLAHHVNQSRKSPFFNGIGSTKSTESKSRQQRK